MHISPLPESTVRLLGSGVTITSPCDLVKELVENAIDARATSIEVSISADSLKQILVRDDGHGIALEDLEALGRRSHTSKLRTFDELQTRHGGETLGFRGEALSSANSIASVTVTTRTDSDPVASRVKLKFGVGGVEDLTKTSAPVGTTIQISKLFEKLPVRKRVALKDGKKSVAQIKDLLRTYALARPHLKLSLKVLEELGGGASKGAWSFSPTNRSPTVHEAVLQIFGRDLASSCVKVSRQVASDKLVPLHVNPPPAITLDAFIPVPGCEAKLIQGKGAHIAVDCRPISSARGFGKKLVKIYKSYLIGALGNQRSSVLSPSPSSSLSSSSSSSSMTNPFLQLNITCPPSSYDSNVTPLKDEVIFSDGDRILKNFERLCRETYPANVVASGVDSVASGAGIEGAIRSGVSPGRVAGHKNEDANKNVEDAPGSQHGTRGVTSEQTRQEVRMRIKSRVNMARAASNTSIDSVVDQSLPVHLLPLSPVREELDPKPKTQTTSDQSPPKYVAESIDYYLQPRRRDEFQIAADETATLGDEARDGNQAVPQRRAWRQPLEPLDASVVNELAGLDELDWSFRESRPQGFNPPIPSNVGVPVRPQTLTAPRPLSNNRQASRLTPRGGFTASDSSPPSRGQQVLSDVASPPAAATGLHGIRTPPSSVPRIDVRIPNHPFQSHRNVFQSQRSNLGGVIGRLSPLASPLYRPRRSVDSMTGRGRAREGSSLPVDLRRLGSSEDLPYQVRSDVLEAVAAPVTARVKARPRSRNGGLANAPVGRRDIEVHGLGRKNSRRDQGETMLSGHQYGSPRQPSRESQQPLSSIEVVDGNEQGRPSSRDHGPPGLMLERLAGRKRCSQNFDEEPTRKCIKATIEGDDDDDNGDGDGDTDGDVDHDAAFNNPNKRRCSRSDRDTPPTGGSSPPSTTLLRRQLGGTTRDEWKTQATWVDLGTSERQIGRWARELAASEPYIVTGRLQESVLPFRNMEEVGGAEARLRRVVGEWAMRAKRGVEVEVEYTLRWTAKGKGTV